MKKYQMMEGQNLRTEGNMQRQDGNICHVYRWITFKHRTMKTHHNQDHTHVHVYLIYPEHKARHNHQDPSSHEMQ